MSNIGLEGRYSCTGCGSCKIICPHNAIEMKISSEGFLKPIIDNEKCTNCSLCTKVCYKYYDLEEDKKSIICTIVINILKLFIHIFVNF